MSLAPYQCFLHCTYAYVVSVGCNAYKNAILMYEYSTKCLSIKHGGRKQSVKEFGYPGHCAGFHQ